MGARQDWMTSPRAVFVIMHLGPQSFFKGWLTRSSHTTLTQDLSKHSSPGNKGRAKQTTTTNMIMNCVCARALLDPILSGDQSSSFNPTIFIFM
ncbi:Uncharacterized protein APZ42_020429 [Daphnia magna]|uniref:Uncharacterized protein n=1 Tax=Daphnia magna TaxID=35525 RepID=A0A162CCR8_9CRUS|nr:Uncharacterized protein APZ42_020429 [Daphnia magna]